MIGTGTLINGKYRLIRLLGDGGMGSVYEAQHEVLKTRVAIKLLHPELSRRTGLVERFLQEARVAAQIRSPRVVQVIDVDRTLPDGHAYIVMELLEGEPLSSVLDRQRKLSVPMACEYTLQILEALEAAHALGVIHRDLKPENVFVTFLGGKPMLKLIDFGIAKARPEVGDAKKALTVAGVIMGTAEYMAPEQARAANLVDARSDVYAVGVMLYEMIAGERPVQGEDARIIALKVERGEVKPLVESAPEVPREIAGLVHRAMAPRPELRFASATEMRLALEGLMKGKRGGTGAMPAQPHAHHAPPQAPPPRAHEGRATHVEPGRPGSAVATSAMPAAPDMGVMTGATTQRAMPTNAMVGPPPMMPPAPPYAQARPRRAVARRGTLIALIVVPLLLGAGVVVALVLAQNADTTPPAPTATATQASAAPEAAAPKPAPSATNTLAPLDVPSTRVPRPNPPGPAPQPGVADAGFPPLFPSGLPSTLPPIPTFQIPSTFPSTFPLPLPMPTAPPTHTVAPPPPSGQPI